MPHCKTIFNTKLEFIQLRLIIILLLCCLILLSSARIAVAETVWIETPEIKLNIMPKTRVALSWRNIMVCPSVTGFFEIYKSNKKYEHQKIHSGPFRGTFKEPVSIFRNGYAFKGSSLKTGHEFNIEVKVKKSNTLEVNYQFYNIKKNEYITVEIMKLLSTVFNEADIVAIPKNPADQQAIPQTPFQTKKRILIKDKNKIILEGSCIEIEIVDLNNSESLSIADFRNIHWDPYKSFYVYANTRSINFNANPSLSYRITFNSVKREKKSIQEISFSKNNSSSAYDIPFKYAHSKVGNFQLKKNTLVVTDNEKKPFTEIFINEFERKTGNYLNLVLRQKDKDFSEKQLLPPFLRHIDDKDTSQDSKNKNCNTIYINENENLFHQGKPIQSEGFEIDIDEKVAHIKGVDKKGCLFGLWAFLTLMEKKEKAWQIPCGTYRDWPDLSQRGICIEMLPPYINDTELFKRFLIAFSKARTNLVVFYHKPAQILSWKNKNASKGWSEIQMKAISDYAKDLEMSVWAGFSQKFSYEKNSFFNIKKNTNIYDPFDERSYPCLFELYEKLIKVYDPTTVLIGYDEIVGLNEYVDETKYTSSQALAKSINRISTWLKKRDLDIAMWGDMLLEHAVWKNFGSANSLNDAYRSGNTHNAIEQISQNIKILDWHYKAYPDYKSIKYFSEKGFKAYGVGWHNPDVAKLLVSSVLGYDGVGVIGTCWGFWRTLSPASTTLYNTICGWNTNVQVDDKLDVQSLAAEFQPAIIGDVSLKPIRLNSICNASTYDKNESNHKAVFDVGPILDLRAFPEGDVLFDKIRFNILPHEEGNTNCIIVDSKNKNHKKLDKEVVIPIQGESCDNIFILHTLFHHNPQYRNRPLGFYELTYNDGTTFSVDIIEGFNIVDVLSKNDLKANDWSFDRHPEILLGSKCVWQGKTVSGLPLNVQMLNIQSRYHKKALKSIRLVANTSLNDYRIAVLGITLSKNIK